MQTAPEGFISWTHLFEHLKEHGFADQQRVALVYPQPLAEGETVADERSTKPEVHQAANEVELYMDEIKARSFDELYERIPTGESIVVMVEMLDSAAKIAGVRQHVNPVKEFLKKLPNRNNLI